MIRLLKAVLTAVIFVGCAFPGVAGEQPSANGPVTPSSPEAASETEAAETLSPATPTFHIQTWDGHKTGWNDDALADLAASGFTIVQNGWKGSGFPSRGLVDQMTRHGLLYGAYLHTGYIFRQEATSTEKAKALFAVGPTGNKSTSELNVFDEIYHAVVTRAVEKGLRNLEGSDGLYKVMVNSERGAPVSYDDVTMAAAVEAGAMKPGERIPIFARGVWRPSSAEAADGLAEPYGFIRWWDSEGGDIAINRVVTNAIQARKANVLVCTDPLADSYSYGRRRGMPILQDWVRVHQAPRDPLSIVFRIERLKAHMRFEEGLAETPEHREIWIGPQLGTSTRAGAYAAPADVFEEALWLAVGFGARGITCWGYNTVRRDHPLDADTWNRIKTFREKLLSEYPYLLEAKDAPRKCAVLLSKANLVFTNRAYYDVDVTYENFYRCLLTAHVPADVIYDDAVLAGRLPEYEAVFLPGIEHSTPELDAALARFKKDGGRVIEWPVLLPRYKDYEITKGNAREDTDPADPGGAYLYPHQYRKWRQLEAAKIFETVKDLMDVTVDNPNVIMNVVESGGKRYAVLINDSRTYGAWTAERGHKWSEDAGVAAKFVLTVGSGDEARTFEGTIPPAGMAVVPL